MRTKNGYDENSPRSLTYIETLGFWWKSNGRLRSTVARFHFYMTGSPSLTVRFGTSVQPLAEDTRV